MPRDTDPSHLHPLIRNVLPELDRQLFQAGIELRLYEAGRSPDRQAALFAVGRDTGTPGKHVTRARAWESMHQYGLAVDYVFWQDGAWSWSEPSPGQWRAYQAIGASLGLRALSFEAPHLEWPTPLSSLQAGRYPAGGDASWRDWLDGMIEGWGAAAKVVGSLTHPGAPPLAIERPALVA